LFALISLVLIGVVVEVAVELTVVANALVAVIVIEVVPLGFKYFLLIG
jgi:hypothetical protein